MNLKLRRKDDGGFFNVFILKDHCMSNFAFNYGRWFILIVYSLKSFPYYQSAALCIWIVQSWYCCNVYMIIFPKNLEQGSGKETKQATKNNKAFSLSYPETCSLYRRSVRGVVPSAVLHYSHVGSTHPCPSCMDMPLHTTV